MTKTATAAVVTLLITAVVGWTVAVATTTVTPESCFSAEDRDRVRKLSLEAVDQAFQEHVGLLFTVWVKDYSPEPKRAVVGMANNISAHKRARANAMAWQPPVCKE